MPCSTQPASWSASSPSRVGAEAAAAVDRHRVAHRAEQRRERDVEQLRLQVPERDVDRGEGHRGCASRSSVPQRGPHRHAGRRRCRGRSSARSQVRAGRRRCAATPAGAYVQPMPTRRRLRPRRPPSSSSPTRSSRRTPGGRSGSCTPRRSGRSSATLSSRRLRGDHRPGAIASSIWRNERRIIEARSGSPRSAALGEVLRLLEGDVRRQRRHLGVDDRLEHGRAGRPRARRPTPRRAGRARRRGRRAGRSARRSGRTGSRGSTACPGSFGSPSIARCSHVTWFRSRLLRTSTTSRGSLHRRQYLATVISSVEAVHLHRAVADERDRRPVGVGELRRDRVRHAAAPSSRAFPESERHHPARAA